MSVRMVALNIDKSGRWIARKAIPADARAEYLKAYGVSREAILRVPKEKSKAQAKALHGQWLAEVETRIECIRAAARGEGQPLTRLNALALAGRWYDWFVAQNDEGGVGRTHWLRLQDHFVWQVLHPHASQEHLEDPQADPSWPWTESVEVRAAVRPVVAEMARTASFLAAEGLSLTAEANTLFVDAVSGRLHAAYDSLVARADGDYSPDPVRLTFPAYVPSGVSNGVDCWGLFAAYAELRKPKPSTIARYRGVFLKLKTDFAGKSAGSITEDEARHWVAGLVTTSRSASTVANVWVNRSGLIGGSNS